MSCKQFYRDRIYAIGGSDGIKTLSTVLSWSLRTGQSYILASMIESRCFHSAVLCGRSIIVCGGKNDRERLRSCELYDIENNRWSRFASLNVPRSDAAACLFREKIYIAGGVDIFTLSSVEVYSFRAKSWTMINFMNVPRRSFSLIAYHGYLYAIGGCTEIYEYNWFVSRPRKFLNFKS